MTRLTGSEQTYSGTSLDKRKSYNCLLRVNKDSTVNYLFNRPNNTMYGEFTGRMKRLSDMLYYISATMTVGHFAMKFPCNDPIYIQMDPSIAIQLDVIEIEYSNRTIMNNLRGYDRMHKPVRVIKIPFNKKLYNINGGTNYFDIAINRKNLITDKWLKFRNTL